MKETKQQKVSGKTKKMKETEQQKVSTKSKKIIKPKIKDYKESNWPVPPKSPPSKKP